jgi:hypothetical protein
MWEQSKVIFLQSLERVAMAVARLLPGLMAMLLILVLSLVLALAVRLVLKRLLAGIALDRRLREWGFLSTVAGESVPKVSPALLVSRLGYWTVLLAGFLVGLNVFEGTSGLAVRLLSFLPQVLAAILISLVGLVLARFLERSVLISAVNMGIHSARLLGLGVKWLVVVLAAAMALDHLGVGGTILTISFGVLFGGVALALSLALGLGSREAVSKSWEKRLQQQKKEQETEDELHHL